MSVSEKTKKIIWGQFAGKCAICKINVTYQNMHKNHSIFGEVAHIIGEKKTSARYDENIPLEKRNHPDNLMLLCANHHTIIDKKENIDEYSVETLKKIKNSHLSWLKQQLEKTEAFTANIYHLFYINIPRLLELAIRYNENINLTYYQNGLALHQQRFEFIHVMHSTQQTLKRLLIKSLKLNLINFPRPEYQGLLIYFEHTRFRTKNIFKKNYEVNTMINGSLKYSPHIYYNHTNFKLILRIDTNWITTQTALGSFSPSGGTNNFTGIARITEIDLENQIMIGSTIVIGLPPSIIDQLMS